MNLRLTSLLLFTAAVATPAVALVSSNSEIPVKVEDEKKPTVFKIGSTVPETLGLPNFNGETTSFKDLRGKVVILHFWSDLCPAERHADPVFKKMEGMYADNKDVVMIGINSNQNELGSKPAKDADRATLYGKLRKKVKKIGYTHSILVDHGNVVSKLFAARSTPHCFVIDKKGVIAYSGALDDDPRGKKGETATNYLTDATTALLAGKKPAVTSTKPYG
jgi:thiol-disulfide isomerase/thioredoxin